MLQMTAEQLNHYNGENIDGLLSLARPILHHRRELYRRYTRKEHPNQFMSGEIKDGKKKAIVAFEYYIVNMVQGYLGGKAPMYSVRKGKKPDGYVKSYMDAIAYIQRYNDDAATFIELLHDYLITAAANLYVYEDQYNEIRYVRFDSRQTVAIYDYSTPPNQIGAVRAWSQTDADGNEQQAVELITAEKRTLYLDGEEQDEKGEMLQWGDVPCIAFEQPDSIAVFEPALSDIETYEQYVDNTRSMTQYNNDAKLLVSGYRPEEPRLIEDENGNLLLNHKRLAEEQAWLEAQIHFLDEKGAMSWLLKNVDYSGTLAEQANIHDRITMVTGVPNMTDEAFANADNASALGYKLYALDQYSATTDRVFKRGYLRLWELITSRLNLKGAAFDFRDIDIRFNRNVPTDKDKSIARAVQMKSSGLYSDETCINESHVEVDAEEELARRDAEEDSDYERLKQHNQPESDD